MASCPTQPLGKVQYEARSLHVDALACARCSAPMLVLAFISDPAVVKKILDHLHLPSALPVPTSARLPDETDLPFIDEPYLADGRDEPSHPAASSPTIPSRSPP